MADLLVDTDVFVDHLRGVRELRREGDSISYSVITRAELFAGHEDEEWRVDTLLTPFREFAIERSVAEAAGRLRRRAGLLLPDALIAATALEHALTLVTRNLRHFAAVPELRIREPA